MTAHIVKLARQLLTYSFDEFLFLPHPVFFQAKGKWMIININAKPATPNGLEVG